MPFKCTKCDTIVQDNELQDCQCETNHFVRCPIIHFIHAEGEGPVFSKQQKISNIPGKIETDLASILKIACTDRKGIEQCTMYGPLISCPKCIEFITKRNFRQPVTIVDKPLDTSNIDISPEDMNILGLPTDHDK